MCGQATKGAAREESIKKKSSICSVMEGIGALWRRYTRGSMSDRVRVIYKRSGSNIPRV